MSLNIPHLELSGAQIVPISFACPRDESIGISASTSRQQYWRITNPDNASPNHTGDAFCTTFNSVPTETCFKVIVVCISPGMFGSSNLSV